VEFCYTCGKKADEEIDGRWYCKEHVPPDIYAGLKRSYQNVSMQTHHLRMIIEMLGEKRIQFPFTETEAKETMQELARAYGVMAFAKDYPEYGKWMLDL